MVELDGPITKVSFRNFSEGAWLFKRGNLYYNVYAADTPGVQPEQMCYSTAPKITGPWSYGGFVTGPAKHGYTIHPAVVEFKGQWYFFYNDGAYELDGSPGGDCRRQVCVEYLYFNSDFIYTDGTVQGPFTGIGTGTGIKANAMPLVMADYYNRTLQLHGEVNTIKNKQQVNNYHQL